MQMAKKPTAIAMNTTSRTMKLPLIGDSELVCDGNGCAPLFAGDSAVWVGKEADLAEMRAVRFNIDGRAFIWQRKASTEKAMVGDLHPPITLNDRQRTALFAGHERCVANA